jgi:hypothetical protein
MYRKEDFNRSFSNQRKYVRFTFAVIVGIVLIIFIAYGYLSSSFKYEIREPDYSHSRSNIGYTSHFCNSYTEDGNCIKFTDEMGNEQKICGSYNIVKHN